MFSVCRNLAVDVIRKEKRVKTLEQFYGSTRSQVEAALVHSSLPSLAHSG